MMFKELIKSNRVKRGIVGAVAAIIMLTASACTKSPDQVREWIRDKRAPQKMQEFIHNERYPLDSKIEALMVLIERNNILEIPDALGEPIKNDEMNQIVAGAVVRMNKLLEESENYDTKIKDASYTLLKLDLNDENKEALTGFIKTWLGREGNFFLPIAKAGRIEQKKLFELLGSESIPYFEKAFRKKLDQYYESFAEEEKMIAEAKAEGKKIKRVTRASVIHMQTIASNLETLRSLKLAGGDDAVAEIFGGDILKHYPNIPQVLALPFSSNESQKLLAVAEKIVSDPEYKNENLNYFKNVVLATYYPKVQRKAGVNVCKTLLQTDRTGYTRWDCLDILTTNAGRDGLAALLQTIPNNYQQLAIPEDHPTLLAHRSMTFWNSVLVYCTHLPSDLNNQVPLDVFRQLATKGNDISKIVSMACLSTNGKDSDVEFLSKITDRTPLTNWGMSVPTMTELGIYTSKTLAARLKAAAEKEAKASATAEKTDTAKAPAANAAAPAANAAAPAANAAAPAANAAAPAANAAAPAAPSAK